MGWLYSLGGVMVLIHNGIPLSKKLVAFASLPYGLILYAWFVLAAHFWLWVLSFWRSEDEPYFEVDWGRVFGEERQVTDG